MKICPRCKLEATFNQNARAADGLQVYCKKCQIVVNRESRDRRRPASRPPIGAALVAARASKAAYKRAHPDRMSVQHRVYRALRSGRLTREPCEQCGATEHVHAHHDDYTKPLERFAGSALVVTEELTRD